MYANVQGNHVSLDSNGISLKISIMCLFSNGIVTSEHTSAILVHNKLPAVIIWLIDTGPEGVDEPMCILEYRTVSSNSYVLSCQQHERHHTVLHCTPQREL